MIDIYSTKPYPNGDLSNLAAHTFVIDGVECASMEGFLQSLKVKDESIQLQMCKQWGLTAKKLGSPIDWKTEQTLYWKGVPYKRDSREYQSLLNKAYMCLATNEGFRKALIDTGSEVLVHSIGKKDVHETVLTEYEFCSRLMAIRLMIREGRI